MSLPDGIPLAGCRHDVLGHALKSIGVLRALSTCATADDCDLLAEGWWDSTTATFNVRSTKYPDADSLGKFFAEKYRPTPIIAAWNKSGGVTDKIEVTISCNVEAIAQFRKDHESVLEEYGLKKEKQVSEAGTLVFKLRDSEQFGALESLVKQSSLTFTSKSKKQGQKTNTEVTIAPELGPLNSFLESQKNLLVELGFGATKELSAAGQLKFASGSGNQATIEQLVATFNAACPAAQTGSNLDMGCNIRPLAAVCEAKESGKKD